MTDNADVRETAKYQRVSAEIRTWLSGGMFEPGEPVPSITDLAAERGWSRQTCARALRTLESEGLLTRYKGFGYYVADTPKPLDKP